MLRVDGEVVERAGSAPQTVLRAIGLLDLLATMPQGMSLRQLSESTGLTKSTAHRLISCLVMCRLAEFCPETRTYKLGIKVLELSAVLLDSMDVREEAKPFLRHLNDVSRETVYLAVLDQFKVVYIGCIESPESMRMSERIGRRNPFYSSSLGKVLVAWADESTLNRCVGDREYPAATPRTITDPVRLIEELAKVRRQGYALDDEENRPGIRCLGAPVRDYTGTVVAAISISGPSFRLSSERVEELIAPLTQAAKAVSERMGYRKGLGGKAAKATVSQPRR